MTGLQQGCPRVSIPVSYTVKCTQGSTLARRTHFDLVYWECSGIVHLYSAVNVSVYRMAHTTSRFCPLHCGLRVFFHLWAAKGLEAKAIDIHRAGSSPCQGPLVASPSSGCCDPSRPRGTPRPQRPFPLPHHTACLPKRVGASKASPGQDYSQMLNCLWGALSRSHTNATEL